MTGFAMTTFSVRVPEDLAARFDAGAELMGGRSAVLRRLIEGAAGPTSGRNPKARAPGRAERLMVRLAPAEASYVAAEARRMSLPRSTWVAALVRRHSRGQPTFSKGDNMALDGMRREVRRIGVNVNQIARALNTAVLEGRVLDLELAHLEDLRGELRAHLRALGEAFEGNLAYWAVDDA
jgi:hypothetical protein